MEPVVFVEGVRKTRCLSQKFVDELASPDGVVIRVKVVYVINELVSQVASGSSAAMVL